MRMKKLLFVNCLVEAPGALEAFPLVAEDLGLATEPRGAIPVAVELTGTGPAFTWDGQSLTVTGASLPQLLRAITLWRGFEQAGEIPRHYQEKSTFKTIGVMIDASRNAVPTPATLRLILRKLALLGINLAMLYTEDTYEVPEQPYFGYLRGRYSQEELADLDTYASKLGIEMMPCIQTLAHLAQALRWSAFHHVCDTSDILLADEPKTYELLDQLIAAATGPYRSKRIHIGMDEADQIGLGVYRQRHGFQPRFPILSRHLKQVASICEKHGVKPMIWSDMYLRLAAKDGNYYGPDARIPDDVVHTIPSNVQLIYWDYYHTNSAFYREWINRHRAAPNDLLMCAGQWSWNVFWQSYSTMRMTNDAAVKAARDGGVSELLTAVWTDDGAEIDLMSVLPGLTCYAASAYGSAMNDEAIGRTFAAATGGDFAEWLACGRLDETPANQSPGEMDRQARAAFATHADHSEQVGWSSINISKTLLWQDPLLGLADGDLATVTGLGEHFAAVRSSLEEISNVVSPAWRRTALPMRLAAVLEIKAELGVRILSAYRMKNRRQLQQICDEALPAVIERAHALHETHRELWFSLYKPFGWEVLDRRYGGMIARLYSTQKRLEDYLQLRIDVIEELEELRLPVMGWTPGKVGCSWWYTKLISPSVIT